MPSINFYLCYSTIMCLKIGCYIGKVPLYLVLLNGVVIYVYYFHIYLRIWNISITNDSAVVLLVCLFGQ